MNFYDPINEQGHKEFNSLFAKNNNHTNYIIYNNNCNNKFLYHLKSIINHYKLLVKSKEDENIFLIFNTFSLYILSFFVKNINSSFVVHNNLDFALRGGRIHYRIYKRIASKFELLYLENRLAKVASEEFCHVSFKVIEHPIIEISKSNLGSYDFKNVFVSGRNLSSMFLNDICDYYERDNNIICNKVIKGVKKKNLQMGFIDDFDKMLASCKKIYIVGNYKYRVSGIVYKALSLPKVIIVFENKDYYMEVRKKIESRSLNCNVELIKAKKQ